MTEYTYPPHPQLALDFSRPDPASLYSSGWSAAPPWARTGMYVSAFCSAWLPADEALALWVAMKLEGQVP